MYLSVINKDAATIVMNVIIQMEMMGDWAGILLTKSIFSGY